MLNKRPPDTIYNVTVHRESTSFLMSVESTSYFAIILSIMYRKIKLYESFVSQVLLYCRLLSYWYSSALYIIALILLFTSCDVIS